MSGPVLPMTHAGRPDRRVPRTRAALRAAFGRLILAKGYHRVTAAEVAGNADVGRSTFYEHYSGKGDILADSLTIVLTPLAACCTTAAVEPALLQAIEHVWQNRSMSRGLLSGEPRAVLARELTRLIEQYLSPATDRPSLACSPPLPLVATQIAHAQLALIDAWLSGRHGCTPNALAAWLHAGARALAIAFAPAPDQNDDATVRP